MKTVHLKAVPSTAAEIPLQEASHDIWKSKYRLKAKNGTPVDQDAGNAGEWESSGIVDVSTLFGWDPGTLFLIDIQAHGIEDQDDFNADSRIVDGDLVEGGQLVFLYND